MKLKTSLQLSAIFPIVFAIAVILVLRLHLGPLSKSSLLDISFMAVLGLMGVTMAAVIISYSRNILKKISVLNNWIKAVLKGDLDHKVRIEHSNDEVGQLSQSLSKMLKELKEAYASLQKEAGQSKDDAVQHKVAAEASQVTTQHLTRALASLKQSQEEVVRQERLQLLERIIRGTVHDFGDAMMPIVGTCDFLVSHPETFNEKDEAFKQVKIIQDGADRLKKLLKNLASFFHAAAESAGPTDANDVVEEAIKLTEPYWKEQAGADGNKIDIRTNLEIIPAVAVEEIDLRDALVNLILNSAEAMPGGGVISISAHGDKSWVSIEVRDTGEGMSEAVRKRCLEPFFSTKKGVGMGMGLTIVSGMIRRYRGKLNVESKPNMGTRISIGIPVWSNKEKEKAVAEKKVSGKLRILVVDDELASRNVVEKVLVLQKHHVETAGSGAEGIEKVKSQKFDVAIIDRAMPGMSGDELAGAIKEVSQKIGVLMLTGFGDIMIEEGEIPLNVDVVVPKPVTMKDLHLALVKAMDIQKAKPARSSRKKNEAEAESSKKLSRESTRGFGVEGQSSDGSDFKWVD
ncbi:ATP-binding protein [Verrucomicrobiota bacterium]